LVGIIFFKNLQEKREKNMSILKQRRGQGLVEYSLMLSLIAVVVVAALVFLADIIEGNWNSYSTAISNAMQTST